MSGHNFLRSITPGGRHRRKQQEEDATRAQQPFAAGLSTRSGPETPRQRPTSSISNQTHHSDSSAGLPVDLDDAADPPTVYDRRPSANASTRSNSQPGSVTGASKRPAVSFFNQDIEPITYSPDHTRSFSNTNTSHRSYETDATSIHTLPALQIKGHGGHEWSQLEPVLEDDPASYDLVNPEQPAGVPAAYSLETRSEQIFSTDHLKTIFSDPKLLLKFTTFLGTYRPDSVPLLIYYLDALKALAAIKYANAVAEALEPLNKLSFTSTLAAPTANSALEEKAQKAFEALARDDLAAFVTHTWVNVVSTSIRRRITGTMPPHLRDASEGLAEVFCLTDPSREDNPIVFSSEEFHRTTQYGVNYVIGRNCRFLQGPRTNQDAVRRLREAVVAGRDTCETFVNYRRDGSPFMNLLMTAPLRDSRGNLRYYIGAQVDVSGLAKECTELDAVQRMLADKADGTMGKQSKGEFEELSEMFNQAELEIVRKSGGALHHEHVDDDDTASTTRPRLLLKDPSAEDASTEYPDQTRQTSMQSSVHGKLIGVYQNYLLVRPHPSLRILFASPSLRVPGILQSPFMNRIGSSERVREELRAALADGRGVTAKIRWVSKHEDEGRNRWIHCTPLLGSNGQIGVWMIVLVDDESSRPVRRFREAPPVAEVIGNRLPTRKYSSLNGDGDDTASPGNYGRTMTMGGDNDYRF